jgi:hypothetical protein
MCRKNAQVSVGEPCTRRIPWREAKAASVR